MATKLSTLTYNHNNNFTLIRFIAAVFVLYTHMNGLMHGTHFPYAQYFGLKLSDVGVDIFFFTSGFLVTASLLIRKDVFAFIWARFLRIYPALLIAVILSILIGAYFTVLPVDVYFKHGLVEKFFFYNTTLYDGIIFFLPGVFNTNFNHAVNGSLWTLPWEIKMYLILFILGVFSFSRPKILSKKGFIIIFGLIVFISLSLLFSERYFHYISDPQIKHALRFLSIFFTGSLYYILRDKIILSTRLFFILLFFIIISHGHIDIYYIFHYLFLGYIILYLSYIPKGKILLFNKLGDYSYGLYIYAFPVQQSVIATYPQMSVLNAFYISFTITLLLSIISWHLLEKKMLTFKKSYFTLKNKIITKFRKINE